MAINIPAFSIALHDHNSCMLPMQMAEKLQGYFGSKVSVFLTSGNRQGIPAGFHVETLSDPKDISKRFLTMESDLLILPLVVDDPNKGVVNATEANKIIDKIERLVLTIPCKSEPLDMAKIVVPIDSSFETRQKVPYAIGMARAFNAKLYVIGVSNDKGKDTEVLIKNYLRQVCNNIEEKGMQCHQEMRLGGNPTDTVLAYAKELQAGMVVIMTEQETNITSFFSGKYSQQMVKNSPIPVLSIHPKDLIVSEARL